MTSRCFVFVLIFIVSTIRSLTQAVPTPDSYDFHDSQDFQDLQDSSDGWDNESEEGFVDSETAHEYFTRFGYVRENEIVSHEAVVKRFQKYAALNETGEMNAATLAMMKWPRCGDPDMQHSEADLNKIMGIDETPDELDNGNSVRKRYAMYGTKWHGNPISYCVVNYPRPGKKSATDAEKAALKREFDRAIETAVKKWTIYIPLGINRVDCSKNPEIRIKFAEGYHNDRFKFDGRGGVLAHAFFPSKKKVNPHPVTGDVHLDLDEHWVNEGKKKGTCFPYVFTHELGHSLGLTHSSNKNSLMWPFYIPCYKAIRLQKDDIEGIQAIYGVPSEQSLEKQNDYMHESAHSYTTNREAQSYCASIQKELCSRKDLQDAIKTDSDLRHTEWYWIRDGRPTKAKVDAVECQKRGDSKSGGCFYDKLLISTVVASEMKALCCPVAVVSPEGRPEYTLCGGVFDAMIRIRAPMIFDHDRLYTMIFKEDKVFAFDVFGKATGRIAFPAKIKERFPSFNEKYVCSVLALPRGNTLHLILFGRQKYYVYDVQDNFHLLEGYPKDFNMWKLDEFGQCPSVVYALKNEIHFVRNEKVWKYTGRGGHVFPKDMKKEMLTPPGFNWTSVASAASWKPGAIFFFNDKGNYYYSRKSRFQPGYPKNTAKAWFHFCPA